MIAATSLRIGNWVFFDKDSLPEQVTVKTFCILDRYPERIDWVKPIPLSADILERAGFVKNDQNVWMNNKSDWQGYPEGDSNVIIEMGGKFYYGIVTNSAYSTCDIEIPFVHTLQNLYFALHKEELTINLLSESVKYKV